MYVSSSSPIPDISTEPLDPAEATAYNARKRRVFLAVANAASRYDCAPAVGSFMGWGLNFQNQVRRARALLNQVGTALSSTVPAVGPMVVIPTVAEAQARITSSGPSSPPIVIPLAPVLTNPSPPLSSPGANWDAPHWGNAATAAGTVPTPQTAAARHPWVTLGIAAALAMAAGILKGGGRRGSRL